MGAIANPSSRGIPRLNTQIWGSTNGIFWCIYLPHPIDEIAPGPALTQCTLAMRRACCVAYIYIYVSNVM